MTDPSGTHPQYDARLPQWQVVADTSAGEDAVKDAGEAYLPKPGGLATDEYAAYKKRASFFNGMGRTLDGLSGMIFRKHPDIEIPDSMADFADDVSLGDLSLVGFAEGLVEEILTSSRAGILVEYPQVTPGGMTRAEADRMNLRPYWTLYRAVSILNWRTGRIGNRTVLTQLRLKETAHKHVDEFTEEAIEQIRVLDLGEDDTQYRQRVFRKDEDKGEWEQYGEDIFPLMNNQPMRYIPFVFVGPRDTTPEVAKPVLLDLAYKNLDHYRIDADYKHQMHFLAAGMTPWGRGVKKEEIDAGYFDTLGATNILLTTSTEAEFGVMEFSGAGMDAMRQALQDDEQQMASLGARMLAPDKRQAEAAETADIHRQGEISVLASISLSVSRALTQALEIARDWMQLEDDVSVTLNTDFKPTAMDSRLFKEWVAATQSGTVSMQEFFDAMQQGELIRADKTFDEHQEELESQGPSLGALGREDEAA